MPSHTRYMYPMKEHINSLNTYTLKTYQNPTTSRTVTQTITSPLKTGYWGIRVWKRSENGTETEITNGTPVAVVTRETVGQSIESNTWECPKTKLNYHDSIVVRVYTKYEGGEWEQSGADTPDFTTEQNIEIEVYGIWTVYYHTWIGLLFGVYYYRYSFGNDYNSRIENYTYQLYKPPLPTLNLIETALTKSKQYRETFDTEINGIKEPLTPQAIRETLYLRIRESLNRGCREAVKLLANRKHRSIAYSILMQATYDIFHYQKTTELMNHYNTVLDTMIGTH